MGLVLRIERRRLGTQAKSIFDAAELGTATVYVPAWVFGEMLYLFEKQRIGLNLDAVAHYMAQFPSYKEYPLDLAVVQAAAQITDIP